MFKKRLRTNWFTQQIFEKLLKYYHRISNEKFRVIILRPSIIFWQNLMILTHRPHIFYPQQFLILLIIEQFIFIIMVKLKGLVVC